VLASQFGYELLQRATGAVTAGNIDTLRARLTLAGDTLDVLAARDSLEQLLGIAPLAS